MHDLKKTIADQLLTAFDPEVKRIDARDTFKAIMSVTTEKLLEANPKVRTEDESIFEEDPDLVANLVQNGIKTLFSDFRSMVLALTDRVQDLQAGSQEAS